MAHRVRMHVHVHVHVHAHREVLPRLLQYLPSPHTPIHREIHKKERPPKAAAPFLEAARSAHSFLDGCVGAGEAADAAETYANVCKTLACVYTLRATFASHQIHGLAQSAGCPNKALQGWIYFMHFLPPTASRYKYSKIVNKNI